MSSDDVLVPVGDLEEVLDLATARLEEDLDKFDAADVPGYDVQEASAAIDRLERLARGGDGG